MIIVHIGPHKKDIEEIEESWIHQQINRRREDGLSVCVRVSIRHASANVLLSTPNCPTSGRRLLSPNPQENKIIDLWKKCGLKQSDFNSQGLVAFLKQIRAYRD